MLSLLYNLVVSSIIKQIQSFRDYKINLYKNNNMKINKISFEGYKVVKKKVVIIANYDDIGVFIFGVSAGIYKIKNFLFIMAVYGLNNNRKHSEFIITKNQLTKKFYFCYNGFLFKSKKDYHSKQNR